MDTFPDPRSLTDQGLKELIKELSDEATLISPDEGPANMDEVQEVDLSYKRRVLHAKIEALRSEVVHRMRERDEGGDGLDGEGSSGVREPRRPGPRPNAGGIALPDPNEDTDDSPELPSRRPAG